LGAGELHQGIGRQRESAINLGENVLVEFEFGRVSEILPPSRACKKPVENTTDFVIQNTRC
jgi:hypothetical protein